MKPCCFNTLIGFSVFFLIAGILLLAWLHPFVNSQLRNHMSLRDPTTQLYENFVNQSLKVSVYKKFSFFNVTNVDDVVNKGHIPQVTLCGPYFYRRIRYRAESEIWWQANGTMRYKWNETYVYEPSMSQPATDVINSVRVGVLFAFQTLASSELADLRWLLDLYAPNITSIFVQKTADELVNGYHEQFLQDLLQPPLVSLAYSHTLDDIPHSEIYDGSSTPSDGLSATDPAYDPVLQDTKSNPGLGWFTMFRGMRNLSKYWTTPETQEIKGTDGSMFPPLTLGNEKEVIAFVEPMRRPLVLEYKRDYDYKGVTVRRYEPRADQYLSRYDNPANTGYHIFQNGFQPKKRVRGVPDADIYGCLTNQLFLDCNTSGVHVAMPRAPDAAHDQSHMDYEPNTGTLLRVRKRSQLNFRLKPMKYDAGKYKVTGTVLLNETWLPYMLESEEMDLPDELVDQIKREVLLPLRLAVPLGTTLTVLGTVSLLATLFLYYRKSNDNDRETGKQ